MNKSTNSYEWINYSVWMNQSIQMNESQMNQLTNSNECINLLEWMNHKWINSSNEWIINESIHQMNES